MLSVSLIIVELAAVGVSLLEVVRVGKLFSVSLLIVELAAVGVSLLEVVVL
jgi:hypothetical protein